MRRFLLLVILVASPVLAIGAGLAHPLDANLPPTAARPELRAAERAGGIARQLLAREGRFACCIKPACGACQQNGAACPCGPNVLQGKGVCGECWEGWRFGKGLFSNVDPQTVRLEAFPARGEEYRKQLPPTTAGSLLAQERKALDGAKRTMFQEGRYACCVRPGCDSCARAGGCPCGASLAAGEGVCGECLGGWHAGHGAFAGIQLSEVRLEQLQPGAAAGHGAAGGSRAGASVMPPSGLLALSSRLSTAALASMASAGGDFAAAAAGDRAALLRAERSLQEARSALGRSGYSLELAARLQAMETAATGPPAARVPAPTGTGAPPEAGRHGIEAATRRLERAETAAREARRTGSGAALALARRELAATRALLEQGAAALQPALRAPGTREAGGLEPQSR